MKRPCLTMEMPTVISYGGDSSSSTYTMSSSVGSHLIGSESNKSQYVHYSLGVYSDVESFNEAPTVSVSSVQYLNEDYSKSFSATVSDPENDTITTTVIQQPSYGNIYRSGNSFTYSPNSNYNGSDYVKLKFDDGFGGVVEKRVTFVVNAVDDDPILDVFSSKTVDEDSSALSIPIVLNDIDSDLNSATYSVSSLDNSIVTAEVSGSNIVLTPIENMFGSTEITVNATIDDKTATQKFLYTLTSVDDTPLLASIGNLKSIGDSSEIDLNLSDIDSDLTLATYEVVSSNPDIATATVENGKLKIVPNGKNSGKVDFTVNATLDGQTVSQTFEYELELPEPEIESDIRISAIDDLKLEFSEDSIIESLNFSIDSVLDIEKVSIISSLEEIKVSIIENSIEIDIPANFVGKSTLILTATDIEGFSLSERFNISISPSEEQVCLASGSDSLTFETIRGENSEQNYIRSSLNLVESLESCDREIPVSWWSSNENIIDIAGNVYIDSEKDYTIQLVATIDGTVQKKFLLTVPKEELNDEIAVEQGYKALTFDSIRNENLLRSEIYTDLDLYSEGVSGTYISWESNSSNLLNNGEIYRTSSDEDILLKGTISKGEISDSKEFFLTIKGEKSDDLDIVEADKIWLSLSNILKENRNATAIKTDLNLYRTGINGSEISWETSDSSIIEINGTVTRDPLIDRYIELKATLQSGETTYYKEFLLKVLKSISFETASDLTFDRVEEIQNEDSQVISIFLENNVSENISSTLSISKELKEKSETIISDESVQTTVENENSLTTIYLNSDGSAETKVETIDDSGNSVETRLNLEVSGGTTEVQDDGSIISKTEFSSVKIDSSGTVTHSIKDTVAESKLAGSMVEVTGNGIKTSYETVRNGTLFEATVKTDSDAKSQTSFSLTNLDTGESIQLDSTLSGESSFDENSTFEIDKSDDGEAQIERLEDN